MIQYTITQTGMSFREREVLSLQTTQDSVNWPHDKADIEADGTPAMPAISKRAPLPQHTLADLLRFYLPLAATSILMMITHSVISGATARTLYPTLALAAYSASYSVGQIFESPCYALQRMCLTFTHGRRSFKKVARVTFSFLGILVLFLSCAAWTPLSRVIFVDILGVSEPVFKMAVPSLRVFILWPISSAVRSIYQTPIVINKQTTWLTVNMVARVVIMFAASAILPRIWPVGPVGAAILMLGLSTEALLALAVTKKRIPPLEDEGPDEPDISTHLILKFALPLALASIIQTFGRPVITASLSRTLEPEIALAGYQVALSYSFIFTALTFNIYHAVVIFVKEQESFKQIKLFTTALGIIAMAGLLISTIPQIGTWILGSVIGAPPETVTQALRSLGFMAIMPLTASRAEFYGGMLMMTQHTFWVTVAKFANVIVSSSIVTTLARIAPEMGSVIGSIALASGSAAEALVCYCMFHRFPDCRRYLGPQNTKPMKRRDGPIVSPEN
jgi:MFS family permease